MRTVEVKYNIDDSVEIIPLVRIGRVITIWITRTGIQYEVRYFDNAEVKSVCFFESELKSKNKEIEK